MACAASTHLEIFSGVRSVSFDAVRLNPKTSIAAYLSFKTWHLSGDEIGAYGCLRILFSLLLYLIGNWLLFPVPNSEPLVELHILGDIGNRSHRNITKSNSGLLNLPTCRVVLEFSVKAGTLERTCYINKRENRIDVLFSISSNSNDNSVQLSQQQMRFFII